MSGKSPALNASTDSQVMTWPGRVLAAEDLRRLGTGYRELLVSPQTIVTPLAAELLRSNGIQLKRQKSETQKEHNATAPKPWGYAVDGPHTLVPAVVQSLSREGIELKELVPIGAEQAAPGQSKPEANLVRWASAVAECIAQGECRCGIVFCQDAPLVSCVANKKAGLRAAPVMTPPQAARAVQSLGANLIAVEPSGKTFHELRQILRTVCKADGPLCPAGVADVLLELENASRSAQSGHGSDKKGGCTCGSHR